MNRLSQVFSYFAESHLFFRLFRERTDLLALLSVVFLCFCLMLNMFRPSRIYILLTVSLQCFFCGSFLLFIFHLCLYCAVLSIPCSTVITCWERVTSWLVERKMIFWLLVFFLLP